MKRILKLFLLNIFALYFANYVWGNLTFDQSFKNLLFVGSILTFFELILRPIINLLLLPINILTLGLIRIITNTLGLYLTSFLIDNFKLENISHPAFSWEGFNFPALNFSGILAYVVTSITISFFLSVTKAILK